MIFFAFITNTYAVEFTVPAGLPNALDAGRAQKNVQEAQPLRRSKAPPLIKNAPPPSAPISGAAKIHFTLKNIIITGNTVIPEQELKNIFIPSIGKNISLEDLENLVQEVSTKYRAEGYILSRAILPAQEIKNGTVKVEIIEGFVSQVTVTGNPGRAKPLLEKYGQRVLQSKPLKLSVLEHEMLLANDLPGLVVKAILTPSKITKDAADLTLVSERKLFSGYLSHDNYGTRYLGPIESSVGVAVNSLLFPGDTTGFHGSVTTKESELQYYDVSHMQPIGSSGLNFTIGSNYTQTQPLFILAPFDSIGRSFSIYSNLTYPVIRSRSLNLYLHAATNYQNVTSEILSTPLYQDRIRSLDLGINFDDVAFWSGYDTLGADVIQGFEILGAGMHELQSRPRGRTKYTRATASGSRLQLIHGRYSLYISATGQYSCQPLLATEQFSFGGPIYGRGYGPSEIVADRGVAAKVELRIDTLPDMRFLQSIEYYIFYDGGVLWNLDTFDLPHKQSATSTGIGARFNFMPQLYGEFYIAKPLTRQDTTLTPTDQNPQQARGFFQIIARL